MSPRRSVTNGRKPQRRRRHRLAKHIPLDLDAVRNAKVLRDTQRLIEDRRQDSGGSPKLLLVRKYLTVAARYGHIEDLERVAAAIRRGDFDSAADPWLARWAAHHLPEATPEQIAAAIEVPWQDYSAEELAEMLHVTYADRERLGLWSFGACDMTRQQRIDKRKADKRKKDRERAERKRREKGAKPSAQYRAESLSQTQPWVPLGISRRTWERRRKSGASLPTAPSEAGHETSTLAQPVTANLKAA
jgi:hypothetical protein